MVTENNSLINSFSTGLDTDSAISNIKDTSYVEGQNVRVSAYGYNKYDLNCKGYIKPINGITLLSSVINDKVERILACGSIRQYGVVVYISLTNSYPEICVSTFSDKIGNGNDLINTVGELDDLKTIFRSKLIDWPANKKEWPNRVSIQFKYEAEDNIKLYIATGFNPIIVLNITKVYESNIDIDNVSSYPKVLTSRPEFRKYISGRLKPGLVRYSYQLYNKHGISTDISPACQGIPVVSFGDQAKKDVLRINGLLFNKDTNCGINIDIYLSKQRCEILDQIRIYRITTLQNGLIPTIEIVYDSTLYNNNDHFIFNDTGQSAIDTISIEEYNSMSGIHIIPKAIVSKDDILFAANVKQKQTFIDDDIFKNWEARAFRADSFGLIKLNSYTSSGTHTWDWNDLSKLCKSTSTIDIEAYNEYNNINKQFNINNCCVFDKDLYYGGLGPNVHWRFITTNVVIDTSSANEGKEIGTLWNTINHENLSKIDNTYFIHKDNGFVAVGSSTGIDDGFSYNTWLIKSLRRNELYRYGIILYDKSGNTSPVKWIADIRTPNLYDKYFNTFVSHCKIGDEYYDLASKPLGIAFSVKLPEGCTGYEIVRCKRSFLDIATVSLGVISKPITEYRCPATQRAAANIYFPTGLLTTATVVLGSDFRYFTSNYNPDGGSKNDAIVVAAKVCLSNITNNNIFQFISPEICYLPESVKSIFNNKDFKLELLRYIFGCSSLNKTDGISGSGDSSFNGFGSQTGGSNGGTFGQAKVSSTEYRDYYSTVIDGITRNFLLPSVCNTNFFVQDNKDWKYLVTSSYDDFSTAEHYNKYLTLQYWLKMPVWMIKSIYYKVRPEDTKWTMRNRGYYNNNSYSKSGNKMNEIDTLVFSYIKLYEQADTIMCRKFNKQDDSEVNYKSISYDTNLVDIKDITIATDLKWNEIIKYTFEEKGSNSNTVNNGRWWPLLEYLNHIDSVGETQYCNAVFYGMNGILLDRGGKLGDDPWTICKDTIDGVNDEDLSLKDGDLTSLQHVGRIPYSTGGRCAILLLKNNEDIGFEIGAVEYFVTDDNNNISLSKDRSKYGKIYINSIPGTSICNLRKTATPYGGASLNAISSSIYYSDGQYFSDSNKWCTTYDGDVYISVLDYTAMHKSMTNFTKDTDADKKRGINDYRSSSVMLGYAIPLESTINCRLAQGYEFCKYSNSEYASLLQVEPSDIDDIYSQTDPEYVFNTAYASEDTLRAHASYDYNNIDDFNKQIDNRVYYSSIKEINENIDSWAKFLSSNYIDVDNRYGEITSLDYYNNTLVFWQLLATGILSVNERAVVNDNNSNELILGSGGVLSRYDYLDTTSGMHNNQFCSTLSDKALYWFDDHNNEIKMMQDKAFVSLGKQCNVLNILYTKSTADNTPIMLFDSKNNEVICNVLDNKESLAYNEHNGFFSSIYTIPFDGGIKFNNGLYLLLVDNGNIKFAQWDAYNKYSTTWNKLYCEARLKYYVNKNPITTKVFDNQEIVTPQDEIKLDGDCYFDNNVHKYSWNTETLSALSTLVGEITNREHNYRYAIPRSGYIDQEEKALSVLYGNRMRGKWLGCTIQNDKPCTDIAIQYIITKFRESWS